MENREYFINMVASVLNKIQNKMQNYKNAVKKQEIIIKKQEEEIKKLKSGSACPSCDTYSKHGLQDMAYMQNTSKNHGSYEKEFSYSNKMNKLNRSPQYGYPFSNYLGDYKKGNIVYEIKSSGISSNENLNGSEYKLACMLKTNTNIIDAANNLLFFTLKAAVNVGMPENTILKLMEPETDDNIYLIRAGFENKDNRKLLDIAKSNETPSKEFTDITDNNFEKVMSAFYPFTYNIEFQIKIIDRNLELQEQVVRRFNSLFCGDFGWLEIKRLIDNDEDKWLLLDILINLSDCSGSIFRRNLGNKSYIRYKQDPNKDTYNYVNYNQLGCKMDTATNKSNKIVLGSSFYSVENDMLFAKILKKYNRKYLAGPSGSTVLLYIHVFDILGFAKSKTNYNLLLGTIVANYTPLYHTVTEILLSASFEIGDRYVINMDPVEFVVNELKSSNII